MELSVIKKQLKDNTLSPYYIFTGEEVKVQDIYIQKIAGGMKTKRVDSLLDIVSTLQRKSFIQSNICYIIRDDKEILTNETIWANLETIIGSNRVIWIYTTLDKRNKFYKYFKDLICDFGYMREDVLKKYVAQEVELSPYSMTKLIDICEKDYSRILLEIDKIKAYGGNPEIAFNELLQQGAIYEPPRDAIFMWVDSVLKAQKKQAFGLYQECKEVGESNLNMLYNLFTNAKQVLQVMTCNSDDLTKSTGLTPWQIKCSKDKVGYYSIEKLIDIMDTIQTIERGIKVGTVPEEMAIDYLMVSIW